MWFNEEKWMEKYHQFRALWIHDGDMSRPHALLPHDMHAGGYFNSRLVAEIPYWLDFAAQDLVEMLLGRIGTREQLSKIDRVIGPAESAATIAHDLARQIVRRAGYWGKGDINLCRFAFAAKTDGKREFPQANFRKNELVLPCEDVLITALNVRAATDAAMGLGATVVPYFVALVNGTGKKEIVFHERKCEIIALIHRNLPMWPAHECPYCRRGSLAIDPRPRENWDRLNSGYTDIARLNLA